MLLKKCNTDTSVCSTDEEVIAFQQTISHHLHYSLAKDKYTATKRDFYLALAYAVKEQMIKRWVETQRAYYDQDVKRVYYLSLEFLMGQTLKSGLVNLRLDKLAEKALKDMGLSLDELAAIEWDAGLGNGGLGRLAACYLDSMATLGIAAYGYGIRYEYGMFYQRIEHGYQVETPDNWLRYGNPWEIGRPEYIYPVHFGGHVNQYTDANGVLKTEWQDTEEVVAMAYDTPVLGFDQCSVNTLRLWSAKSSRGFDLSYFNHGDYIRAVEDSNRTENISRVLYPNDSILAGRDLRLRQEYFLVSATLQDIMRRYSKHHKDFKQFSDKTAIQLNDTHPALAIPELMRLLVDIHGLAWDEAWKITQNTFGYTNHTILPEALEKWSLPLFERLLPRHLQIIYEINRRLMEEVQKKYPEDVGKLGRLSLIEEGPVKRVRMANLAIHGSHSINGVSALHSDLLKRVLFKDFYELTPDKFRNVTNGITPRRWLQVANPGLSQLISDHIGDGWMHDLNELKKLLPFRDDAKFRSAWAAVKRANKQRLAEDIALTHDVKVNLDSMFDCQVKRLHEYKRQLLNALNIVVMYNRLKKAPGSDFTPRTVILAGKAAPGYFIAKLIIKLISNIAAVVNSDKDIQDRLKVVFMANYRVSLAELIIPASDLSQQISTAGYEASGTGNMKFGLNGALTIGTLDGATIEMAEQVGKEHFFLFGLTADEVINLKHTGYNPYQYYSANPELKRAIDMIRDGDFSPEQPDLFHPIIDTLFTGGDPFLVLADFTAYQKSQEEVGRAYIDQERWIRSSITNVANMGFFSSDRSIEEYAAFWGVKSTEIPYTDLI